MLVHGPHFQCPRYQRYLRPPLAPILKNLPLSTSVNSRGPLTTQVEASRAWSLVKEGQEPPQSTEHRAPGCAHERWSAEHRAMSEAGPSFSARSSPLLWKEENSSTLSAVVAKSEPTRASDHWVLSENRVLPLPVLTQQELHASGDADPPAFGSSQTNTALQPLERRWDCTPQDCQASTTHAGRSTLPSGPQFSHQ